MTLAKARPGHARPVMGLTSELIRSVLDVPDEEPENLLNLARLSAHTASPFKEKNGSPLNEPKNAKNTEIFASCAFPTRFALIVLDDLGYLPRTSPCHTRA